MFTNLRKLPSLDGIRTFIVVTRRLSITRAAEELHRSQSAVSRQLQTLERALGRKLVVRAHRRIRLTADGARLYAVAQPALEQLERGVSELLDDGARRPVTVSASIGVTALWFLPRLGEFQREHPGIDVRVAASNALEDLRAEGIDLAIRYGRRGDASREGTHLFDEIVRPVASPELGARPVNEKMLADSVLIDFDDPEHPGLRWETPLAAMGLDERTPKGVLRFNQYDQVIQAALAGQGVALGRLPLIHHLIDEGRLVTLDREAAVPHSQYAYWVLGCRDSRPAVRAVAEWIVAQARATEKRLTEGRSSGLGSEDLA